MVNMTIKKKCVLCDQLAHYDDSFDSLTVLYDCGNCGLYSIDIDLVGSAETLFKKSELALISHIIGRQKEKWDRKFRIDVKWMKKAIKSYSLPKPKTMLDNFILWLGKKLDAYGAHHDFKTLSNIVAEIGALNENSLYLIVEEAQNRGLINRAITAHKFDSGEIGVVITGSLVLTFKGWEYFEALDAGEIDSKLAFMAMPFGDDDLDKVFIEYWKPSVEKAGFFLERIDERPAAGSIDDRLRQKIRRSAFLVCELTNANNGAYWEAGFAEGAGIPVIYTCKKENHNKDSHFDVNHHLCIIWNDTNLDIKSKELTSVILETFKIRKATADSGLNI
jgi:hypothetical protein